MPSQIDYTQIKHRPSSPFTPSADYNFTPLQPGGSLIVGSNAIVLDPAPSGMAVGNYLYVSGGTGTAEAVPVTAWNSGTGTVTVTCANTHSGAWTIRSASGGIKEAATVIGSGTVLLPNSSVSIYATLVLPTTISLVGQFGSTTDGTTGSVLNCASAASPALVIADANWGVTSQGMAIHSDYTLYGTGTGYGLWIGGDPSSVFAPSAWQGSYTRTYNLSVRNFATALTIRHGEFLSFVNSAFSGHVVGLYIPSDAAGEFQPTEFIGCLVGVYTTGSAVRMDNAGFQSAPIHFVGGQIVGQITGDEVAWDSQGTHYEANTYKTPIINITTVATHRVYITGGEASVHKDPLNPTDTMAAAFVMSCAGGNFLHLRDIWFVADVGLTVTNLVQYGPNSGGVLYGALAIGNVDIALAGVVTNTMAITSLSIQAASVSVTQPVINASTSIAAGATVTFRGSNYPITQSWTITGATVGGSGITAIAGLLPGASGMLRSVNAQTFTAGATIGTTVTLAANSPYSFYYDGTQIWIR